MEIIHVYHGDPLYVYSGHEISELLPRFDQHADQNGQVLVCTLEPQVREFGFYFRQALLL
jgi:hypothetical protein